MDFFSKKICSFQPINARALHASSLEVSIFLDKVCGGFFYVPPQRRKLWPGLGSSPTQDAGHRQDYYMFSDLESPKTFICNCYWVGGRSNIWHLKWWWVYKFQNKNRVNLPATLDWKMMQFDLPMYLCSKEWQEKSPTRWVFQR